MSYSAFANRFTPLRLGIDYFDSEVGVIGSSNVSQWESVAGTLSFTQGTALNQPSLVTDNGMQTIYFDNLGSDPQYMDISSLTLTHNCAIFVAFKYVTQNTFGSSEMRTMFGPQGDSAGNLSTYSLVLLSTNSADYPGFRIVVPTLGSRPSLTYTYISPDDKYKVFTLLNNDNQVSSYINDINMINTIGDRTGSFNSSYRLGADVSGTGKRWWTGNVRFLIPVTRSLEQAEFEAIRKFLYDRTGITP